MSQSLRLPVLLLIAWVFTASLAHAQATKMNVIAVPPSDERPAGMKDITAEPDTYIATYIPNVEYSKRAGHALVLQIIKPRDGPPLPGMPVAGAHKPKRPLIVYVQGSAWKKQDLYAAIPQLSEFAHLGYVVASVEYTPSSEARAPAQIQDVKTAIRFLRASAVVYGIDPERVAIWGDSSGGHMASLVGTTAGMPSFETKDYPEQSDAVRAVVDFYGPADLSQMGRFPSWIDHDAPDSPESGLLGKALPSDPAGASANSPVHYVTRGKNIPPFLIMHGDRDVLVPFNQSVLLYEALKDVGAECAFYRVVGGNHGWDFWTPAVMKTVRDFLDSKLKD